MHGQSTEPAFSLFAPPYVEFLPVDPTDAFPSRREVMRGVALVWAMAQGHGPAELRLAAERPGGVPLMVILPPAKVVRRLKDRVLEVVEETRPQSILPYHPSPDPEEMGHLLRRAPEGLVGELMDFLAWRGLPFDQETRRIIRRIVELSSEIRTLTALARGVYLSRRALGRRFKDRGLPVPSHWLQFCRILRGVIKIQSSDSPLHEVARSLGYPDGFTLSNQMERLVGVRPSFARQRFGWEWVAEAWLQAERAGGGLVVPLRGMDASERMEGTAPSEVRAAAPPRESAGSSSPEASASARSASGAEPCGAAA
jgi:AraC-like DNA-binding protein